MPAHRVLSPLPLFDETSLLNACVSHADPIAGLHVTSLYKSLLKQELDQYHPGYTERMQSRIASRTASKQASRQQSRQGSRRGSNAGTAGATMVDGEEKKEEKTINEEEEEEEEKESTTDAVESTDASAAAASSPLVTGDDTSSTTSSTTSTSAADVGTGILELERLARLKLEAEDDALLVGLSTFPLSKFAPTADELADETNPMHTKIIEAGSIPGLPSRLYPLLKEKFSYLTSRLQSYKTSSDGSTTKLLIRLQDGQHIESVIMRHKERAIATGRLEQRITLCVSSQVGCAERCTFCSTGTMGMRGNLMMGEILEQLVIANRFEKIRNIVFMGMGEPLKNYEAVLSAIRAMTDGHRFGLAPSRITLSTVGVVPKMLQLTRDIPNIQLALSLHAPTQELRQKIVPTAKSYPIEKLIEACDYFIQRSKKRILIEYVLLDGVNASEKEAHELGQLLRGKDVMINLIPYNSTSVAATYHAPSTEDSRKFRAILTDEYKIFTTIRVEMGADINGACGQLALENQNLEMKGKSGSGGESTSSSTVVKPRGLMDDTATVDDEELLPSSSSGACGSATQPSAMDIEDIGVRTTAAAKKAASVLVKKKTAVNGSESASSSSSTTAAPSPSSSVTCCSSNPTAKCDCELTSASSSSSSSSSSASAPLETKTAETAIDEEELTVAELLKRSGIKSYADKTDTAAMSSSSSSSSIISSSSSKSSSTAPSTLFLTAAETTLVEKHRSIESWRYHDKLQQVVIGLILLIFGVLAVQLKLV